MSPQDEAGFSHYYSGWRAPRYDVQRDGYTLSDGRFVPTPEWIHAPNLSAFVSAQDKIAAPGDWRSCLRGGGE